MKFFLRLFCFWSGFQTLHNAPYDKKQILCKEGFGWYPYDELNGDCFKCPLKSAIRTDERGNEARYCEPGCGPPWFHKDEKSGLCQRCKRCAIETETPHTERTDVSLSLCEQDMSEKPNNPEQEGNSLPPRGIAAIVVAILAAIAVFSGVAVFFWKRLHAAPHNMQINGENRQNETEETTGGERAGMLDGNREESV